MAEKRMSLPRVAVIGCGYWGKNLVRNFHELGALAAVTDSVPERAEEASCRFGVPAMDLDQLLGTPTIEAVAIATPAECHANVTLAALAAGKHVFVEKPLALTVEDGERMVVACREAQRILMVGHVFRYHPAFSRLQAMVAAGDLGRLQYIYSHSLNLGKFRREENVVWSFAPHDISMVLALANEVPEAVDAIGQCYLHRYICDVTTTHLTFASGIAAHVFVSWLHPSKERKVVVIGDQGMALFDDTQSWDRKLLRFSHKVAWRNGIPEPSRAEAEPVALEQGEPLALECDHFLECVRNGSKPRTDALEGLTVLRVLQAAQQALRAREAGPPPAPSSPANGWRAHPTACIEDGAEIGTGTRIWHFAHIMPGARIGRGCVLGQNVFIDRDVVVGDGCKLQNNVSLYAGVSLEDGVFCGPSCVFTNVLNPRAGIERKNEIRRTRVRTGVTIGANATIVCGHELGEYAFVAAGAVVTHDVPPFALVAGSPARRIGWVSHAGERLSTDLVCPRSGRRYREVNANTLVELPQA